MKKLLIVAAGVGALGVAGCDVNVTSNDAATQQAINQAQDTLGDIGNEAGELARDAGNGMQDVSNRLDNVSIDINTNTAAGNRQ